MFVAFTIFPNALAAASMRPPVSTRPFSWSKLSAVPRTRVRELFIEMSGSLAMISAATPETYGVAIDVPEASR